MGTDVRRVRLRSRELRRLARIDRRSRLRPGDRVRMLAAACAAMAAGYLIASWPGVALAASSAAISFRSSALPVGAGVTLVAAGAVTTLVEADMVRTLRYATDRPVAAALVQSGVILIMAATAIQMVVARSDRSPPARAPLPVPTSRQRRFLGELMAVGAVGFGAWRLVGPASLSAELDTAVRRLDEGMALTAALEGLGADTRAALFPVTAVAMGPVAGPTLGCLAIAAGATGAWAATRLARAQPPAALRWLLVAAVMAAGGAFGADLADSLAVGLTAAAAALLMTKTRAGVLLGSVLLALATLSRPETVLMTPFVLFLGYDADARQGIVPLLAPLAYVATLWPWAQWSERELGRSVFAVLDFGTVARLAVPVALLWITIAAMRARLARAPIPELDAVG